MIDFEMFIIRRIMTTDQVAKYLGIWPQEVRKMSREGKLKGRLLGSRFLIFDKIDIETYREKILN